MVQKSVLRKIGVFAMAVMLAVAPIMAVNAESANRMAEAAAGTGDTTSDPVATPNPGNTGSGNTGSPVATPAPATETPAPEEDEEDDSDAGSGTNYVVVAQSGQELVSTVPGFYSVSCVPGVAITTPRGQLPDGMEVGVVNSCRGLKAAQSIQDGLAILTQSGVSAAKGPEIDVMAYINGANETDLDRKFVISIGIPSEFKQAGYDYAVMLIQVGGRVSILPNVSTDPGMITVSTSGFGVYVIVKAPAGSFKNFQ